MTGPGDTLVGLVHAIDRLDWDGVRAAFADQLSLDYTSLFGGEAERLPADDLVARWQGLLPGFDSTQHLLGPVRERTNAGEAAVEAHVRAYHRIDGADPSTGVVWMVAGHYVVALVRQDGGWRISSLTLETHYQDGDLGLPDAAAERARTAPRPAGG